MLRATLFAAMLLPSLAAAQAIKCTDPVSGRILYTDQPCKGGELVVPPRTEEELRQDAQAAAVAREQALRRAELAAQREQQRLDAAQAQQAREQARRAASPAESEACRAARAEASFRAASFSASKQEIRTARYNAALACGQQPPADIVVVPPYVPLAPHRPPHPGWGERPRPRPPGWGGGFGMPRPPIPEPVREPIPVRVQPPSVR